MKKGIALMMCLALMLTAVPAAFADNEIWVNASATTLSVGGTVDEAYRAEEAVFVTLGGAGKHKATIKEGGAFSTSFQNLNGEYTRLTVVCGEATLYDTDKTFTFVAPPVVIEETPTQVDGTGGGVDGTTKTEGNNTIKIEGGDTTKTEGTTPTTGEGTTPTTGEGTTPTTGEGTTPTTGEGTTPTTGEGTTPTTGEGTTPTTGDGTVPPISDGTPVVGEGAIEGLVPIGEPEPQMQIMSGMMLMSVAAPVTITMTDKGFTFSGTGATPNAALTVKLMDGASVVRTLSPAIRADASGNFSGSFPLTGIPPKLYTLNIDDGTGAVNNTPPVAATVPLIVDPISDGSAVITGMTSPYMLVTVETLINNKYERITVLSNFRGAFYASFSKPPRWDWGVRVQVADRATPNTYIVDKNYPVNRAKDMPTYPNDLEYGQYGVGVLAMQQRLYEIGYDVDITGQFDSKTLKAVLEFQRINYLATDGIAGPVTRGLLFSVTAREYVTSFDSAGVLRYGDEGVEFLQKRLRTLKYYYGPIDGVYGRSTENAVRAFERKNKLPIDGIADNVMQALLFSDAAKIGPGSSSGYSGDSSTTYATSKPTATPTPAPTMDPNALAVNELKVTSSMKFGTWDTLLEKELLRGTLRIEAESAYALTDIGKPGMMLRATYIDTKGNQIPCRIRWQSDTGTFLSMDEVRGVIAEQGNPYTDKLGNAYWSLTPFMEAQRLGSTATPSVGTDNMLLWLGRPILNVQPGKQWRLVVEMLDIYSDTLQLDRTELPLVLQESAIVGLDETTLRTEGWDITKMTPPTVDNAKDLATQG